MLADGIGCCIRMVVRRAAPSSLRMIIRSIVEAARGLDNVKISGGGPRCKKRKKRASHAILCILLFGFLYSQDRVYVAFQGSEKTTGIQLGHTSCIDTSKACAL